MTARPADDPDPSVALRGVHLAFGRRSVFDGLDVRMPRGRISVILGGSGSGKSTLLRIVAGLQAIDRGELRVAGQSLEGADEATWRGVRRGLGMLFQKGALLDSMTVFENTALPLREHTRLDEREIADAVHQSFESLGLHDVDDLLPGELSGGMLKRAALARAIITRPDILLCDEPFSGLDPPNVVRIEALLTRLARERGLTLLVTSHHIPSSLRMADQLVLLADGRAIVGPPDEMATCPDVVVAGFLRPEAVP